MDKSISYYVSEANRIQGSLAERERVVKAKKEEFKQLIHDLPEELCLQLEQQYGISLRRFQVADIDTMTPSEIQQMQAEAEDVIAQIKQQLTMTFDKFRGD